jgi:branched-chain amino acid transport system ATP-binding protein
VANPLLRLSDVRRRFGGVQAVDGVSLDVPEGSVYGLIGPNGAGKTTLVNLVTGYLRPDGGQVRFGDADVTGRPPHAVAAAGIARTFQNVRLYRHLTAVENVIAGMHLHRRHDTVRSVAALPGGRAQRRIREGAAEDLLARVGLDPATFAGRPAATLAYGDQRRLEIARALALRPRLLILDEPGAGMNAAEKGRLGDLVAELAAGSLTVLLIDHDMRLVMAACDRLAVLDFGRKIADGPPAQVSSDPAVLASYLGTRAAGADADSEAGADRPPPPPTAQGKVPASRAGLEVVGLEVAYGPVKAVDGVSLTVAEGEVVALLGANGAGKSTVLNTLSGLVRPRAGKATFDGLELTVASPSRIVGHGVVQVPEGREILGRLTVRENLALGAWTRRDRRDVDRDIAGFEERFPILGQRRGLPAGQLSGGEQQILAIVRSLLARPRLLLLDEPSLGLAPQLVDTIFDVIREISADGLTILLVEQNALRSLGVAQRAYVIERGKVVLSGRPDELRKDPALQRAYLGG